MIARLFMVGLLAVTATVPAAMAANINNAARQEVEAAVAAMGGKAVLKSIHTLAFDAVGHRNMLEQSVRPRGPWWQDYYQIHVTRDFTTHSERVSQKHRGYSSPDWWLKNKRWNGAPYYPTYIVSDGAIAKVVNGKYSPYSGKYLQDAQEIFAFGPIDLLKTALAAQDLHALPDEDFHGFTHHLVAFTWKGYPARIYLNGYTHLPEAVEWTDPRPYDVFWNVWGDVTTRVTYGMWALEPDGLRFPRQWTTERDGMPALDLTMTSLTVNPRTKPSTFHIPAKVKKAYLADKRTIDDIPLGTPGKPAVAIEPGLIHIPGAWNVNLIRQPNGIVVLEGPISSAYSVKVLKAAHRRFPKLPVKAVITTSNAWPHIGGMREYVARGIPIYTLALNKPILERLFKAPHTYIPDDLQKHPRAPKWRLITKKTALGTGANRLELMPYRTETGERQMLVYFPAYKLLYTSDLFSPNTYRISSHTWFTPEYLLEIRNAIVRKHLSVKKVFGMHYGVTPWETLTSALKRYLSNNSKPDTTKSHRPSM